MNLGDRLITLRKSKGLSQEDLAEKLNVTRQTISKWETGQSMPDFDKIMPLCKIYNITSDELITGKVTTNINNNSFEDMSSKKAKYLMLAIIIYSLSIIWMMVSVIVIKLHPIICSAIFIFMCSIATSLIIYSNIAFKKAKSSGEILITKIRNVLRILVFIIYLVISIYTNLWSVTWFIWLIYILVIEIIKLIIFIRSDDK